MLYKLKQVEKTQKSAEAGCLNFQLVQFFLQCMNLIKHQVIHKLSHLFEFKSNLFTRLLKTSMPKKVCETNLRDIKRVPRVQRVIYALINDQDCSSKLLVL